MRYAKIMENDTVDTLNGIAVSLWTQGCPFRCKGCHNPETWDFNGGIEDDIEKIIEKIKQLLNKNNIKRDLSILGGEPLCDENIDFTKKVIIEISKFQDFSKVIYLWTGYSIEEAQKRLGEAFSYITYIVTEPFILKERNLMLSLRGSNNQKVYQITKDFIVNINDIIDKK